MCGPGTAVGRGEERGRERGRGGEREREREREREKDRIINVLYKSKEIPNFQLTSDKDTSLTTSVHTHNVMYLSLIHI